MSGIWRAVRLGPCKPPSNGTIVAEGETEAFVASFWVTGEFLIIWTDTTRIRRLKPESLAKRRRTRLKTRLAKAMPLFADAFEVRELAARPEFYAGKRAD